MPLSFAFFSAPFQSYKMDCLKVETENPTLIVLFRPLSLESFAHSGGSIEQPAVMTSYMQRV